MTIHSRALTVIGLVAASLTVTAALAATAAPGKFSDFTLVKVKGQATVYVIKGPYRNPIRSKVDFDRLGYRTYAVRTISAADLKPYKLGATLAYVPAGEGSLVTSASDKTVYLVEDGYRRPVAGPSVLAARGYSFREIKRLHPVQLEQLPLGARVTVRERRDGQLVRTAKNPTVYLLESGQKKPVVSAPAFETRGYRWEQVKVVRAAELDTYPTGETITDTAQPTLARVSSCDDLARLVRQPQRETWRFNEFTEFSSDRFGAPASAGALGDTVNQGLSFGTIVGWGAPEAGRDFSTTNVQVAGVDEADVVKTDGTYLYALSVREVSISTATPPDQAKRLAVIAAAGPDFTPTDLFVAGNRLAVIGAVGLARHGDLDWLESALVEGRRVRVGPTRIALYDIRDRAKPTLVRTVEVDGSYQTARLIGDELYLVLQSSPAVRPLDAAADGTQLLPTVRDGLGGSLGEPRPLVNCDAVRYLNPITEGTFVTVANLNLAQDTRPLDALVILGGDSQVYVSRTNLYLARAQHNPSEGNRLRSLTQTNLYRIQLARGTLALTGSAIVPGTTLNQFSMDEHNGYVRIATTLAGGRWGSRSSAGVYVLDGDLRQVGAVENLAPGERIFAARFLGPKGYLVTFRQIDPLFTLDLADPVAPRLVGELKVAGFSTYLHPYDDTHLIGLGENTDDPELGTQAGIKLALFDLTDFAHPVEQFTTVVALGSAITPAGKDHRAFLFDRAKNLLVIPVVSTQQTLAADAAGVSRREESVRLDAYVYRLTLDRGFELKAKISHLAGGVFSERDLGDDLTGSVAVIENFILRSLYIGNHLYTFSPGRWVITDLGTYQKSGEIRLEDLAGLLEEQLTNARRQSRDAKRLSDIKQVQTGFALYFNDRDAYPTAVAEITLGSEAARCLSTTSGLAAVCTGTVYLSSVPADPQAPDRQYLLQPNSGDPTAYCITFELEASSAGYPAGKLFATPGGGINTTGCIASSRASRPSY